MNCGIIYIKKNINNLWHLKMQYLCVFTARVKDKGFYLKMTKLTFSSTRCVALTICNRCVSLRKCTVFGLGDYYMP